jgi:predicted glycogen debranching enzyme
LFSLIQRPLIHEMFIEIPRHVLSDPAKALELEWLDTNGLGGWASSTVLGCNTRNYHGVLVAAVKPPVDRKVMLSRFDESVIVNGETIHLSTRDFGDVLYPQGYQYLESFKQDIFPSWEFRIGNSIIRKTLLCIQDQNSVCIRYELDSEDSLPILFEPFVAARDYHGHYGQDSILNQNYEYEDNSLLLRPRSSLPNISLTGPFATYQHNPHWHKRFFYREESKRGLADREDLLCVGKLEAILSKNSPITILLSCEASNDNSADILYAKELQQRQCLSTQLQVSTKLDILTKHLSVAAQQFIVKRGEGKTIIAGYHWFTDWGRDTLIAIRGLCIATGKLTEAQKILQVFCDSVKNGLVPNRFVEAGQEAEYNSVDASLWLFVAAYEFYNAGGDKTFARCVLLPALTKIFEAYCQGTSYLIKEDSDGLINAGDSHIQLSWMDAKIGDWVVTPRYGKAVEINALWYNALNILGFFADNFDEYSLANLAREKAKKTQLSFNEIFWNETTTSLYDCIRPDFSDPSMRPNQIFAIGLPFALLSKERAAAVLKNIREELLTPRGLRTLSPAHPDYKAVYEGSPHQRDSAYHQGTVWPWLLGTYIDAILFVDPVAGAKEAKEILEGMHSHLYEAGLGSISEIFDAEAPHKARGAIAQAWSVSELLRSCLRVNQPPTGPPI